MSRWTYHFKFFDIPIYAHSFLVTPFFFDTPPLQMAGTGAGYIYTRSSAQVRRVQTLRENENVPLGEQETDEPI